MSKCGNEYFKDGNGKCTLPRCKLGISTDPDLDYVWSSQSHIAEQKTPNFIGGTVATWDLHPERSPAF